MNETLIHNINSVAKKDDTIWFLGDFGFFKETQDYDVIRSRIICENINIIWGNHDHKNKIRHCFKEAHEQVLIKVNGQRIVLNHYPMLSWENDNKGAWMLHGHCHGNMNDWINNNEDMKNAKIVDLGVDCWNFKLLSFNDIKEYMDKKPGKLLRGR